MRKLRLIMIFLLSDLLIYTPLLEADQLSLPSGDLIAPEVTHAPIKGKVAAGDSMEIKAKVTDNLGVQSVILFYRTEGSNAEYQRSTMNRIIATDDYSAIIRDIQGPGVEYYIQATDLAGNSLLHGHSFSPLTLAVREAMSGSDQVAVVGNNNSTMEASLTKASESSAISGKTWLWIGLGVLAVGALASGGGDKDKPVITKPTGTVVIAAPAP